MKNFEDRGYNEITETWKAVHEAGAIKRANNRDNSADYLKERNIPFVSKNGGAHLIVEGTTCFIDYWPGTGRWNTRDGVKGFGVRNLVKHITGE